MSELDQTAAQPAQAAEVPSTQAVQPAAPTAPATVGVSAGVLKKKLAGRRARAAAEGGGAEGGAEGHGHDNEKKESEDKIADRAFRGQRIAVPFQAEMEKAFGVSFGSVEAFVAEDETEEMGAEGFAVGHKIAFKDHSPAKHIVAHELAHVVQAMGGNGGGGGSGDVEGEADEAAAAVMQGRKAEVKTAVSGGVHKWGGADHKALGDLGGQKALSRFRSQFPDAANGPKTTTTDVQHSAIQPGQPGQEIPANQGMTTKKEETIALGTGKNSGFFGKGPATQISMGDASRFSGDYAQTPDGLKGKNPSDLVGTINDAGMIFGASTNANHFYPTNRFEYAGHHQKAIAKAASGDLDGAMLEEGFAAHFLQDTFSSGHMAPRSLDSVEHMHNDPKTKSTLQKIGEAITPGSKSIPFAEDAAKGLKRSKTWHDFFCMLPDGLPTDKGRFHGDDYMDGKDLEHVSNVVADSMMEVLSATQGKPQNLGAAGQIPTPSYSQIMSDPVAGPAWKLMINDYKDDLAKAKKDIKPGQKGVTDGGTEFDSQQALQMMQQNVFGEGQEQDQGGGGILGAANKMHDQMEKAAANPLGFYSKQANDLQVQLTGSLKSLAHYTRASFGHNIHTMLDDDNKHVAKDEANWHLGDLEGKYKLVSNIESNVSSYLQDLDGYAGGLQKANLGDQAKDASQRLDAARTLANDIKSAVGNWKQRVDTCKSFLSSKATAQSLTAKTGEEVDPLLTRAQGLKKLVTGDQVGDVGPLPGKAAPQTAMG